MKGMSNKKMTMLAIQCAKRGLLLGKYVDHSSSLIRSIFSLEKK